MNNETTASLRITIWRAYRPARALAVYTSGAMPVVSVTSSADAPLHREVFSWQAREDIWGGLDDDKTRLELMEKFRTDFDALLPPADRTIDKFGRLLDELRPVATSNASKWTASSQTDTDDPSVNYGVNALLAFYNQMAWVYKMFKNAPDASVTVR
jgi:hypothetical protein